MAVMAQLEIDGLAGGRFRVGSDTSWRCHRSPIMRSEIYDGELYDARTEVQDWNKHGPDYIDSDWEAVSILEFPRAQLYAPNAPPVRVTEILSPRKISPHQLGRLFSTLARIWLEDFSYIR
jgi:alpha-L-rhamnosidase